MSPDPFPTRPRAATLGVLGLLLVTIGAPTAWTQSFPSTVPSQVMFDNFETTNPPRPPDDPLDGSGAIWDEWSFNTTDFRYRLAVPPQTSGGIWGLRCIQENTTNNRNHEGYLMVKQSMLGNPGYDPADWTNFRIDVDLTVTRNGIPGIAWGVHDPDNDGVPDQGYLFTISGFPTENQARRGTRATWTLERIDAENSSTVVDQGTVNLPSPDDYTRFMVHYYGFRVRLEWYCNDLRVRVQRIYNTSVIPQRFYGCGSGCANPSLDPEACWCTLAEWADPGGSLTPGITGIYHTGRRNSPPPNNLNQTMWDNFEVSSWGPACGENCDPWTGWTKTSSEVIPFKLLYESGLLDYSAGRNVTGRKIDVNTSEPDTTSSRNSRDTNYCNGWNLLVNLPAPGLSTDIDDILAFLQPMATAVDYVSDGSGGFSWQDNFDNDSESPTYNPVPMIADGATPINNSLLDAYYWYVNQVTDGEWANDPLKACREWYVVLITDGAESCAGTGEYACDPDQAAEKFANPGEDIDSVPVYTIGFSESVGDAPSQLTCISDMTGGTYYGALNAGELRDALDDLYYSLETAARSFTPFKIAPPPSGPDPDNEVQDSLVVYPIFQAVKYKTIWNGNLYGFRFNKDNTAIPTTGACVIDFTQLVVEEVSGNAWDANARLAAQLAEADPTRHVFMASDITDTWARHDLVTIPTNDTLRDEFRDLLGRGDGVSNLQAQEIVNFVRGLWMDNDPLVDPDPNPDPRQGNLSALGDIYHSQPVLVNPPSRSMYFFDYGFSAPGVTGAHDYQDFMRKHAKRRRVVFAGANDGMLHAFDGGIWDRNRAGVDETYDKIHDLGDGSELFAYVPQAVMPNLYSMTYGDEQDWMVDGPIEVSDAFIDPNGGSDREWRTVAIATMRRGGRGMVALDITQPDPILDTTDFIPEKSDLPGCIDGTTPGCGGVEYPKVLWEFSDTTDEDNNCDVVAPSGDDCKPYWDLGWTWSKPAIARIAIYNSSEKNEPDDIFVAFFGGGWDESEKDRTGRHIYGVNVANGDVIVKQSIGVPLPGGVTVLDSDDDGFHDRVYFADSDGSVWRIKYPAPNTSGATSAKAAEDGSEPGVIKRIWDFRNSLTDRQMFFHRPVAVSTIVEGGKKVWALTLGSGNRADLGETGFVDEDGVDTSQVSHFFFLLDMDDDTTRDASHLTSVSYDALDSGTFACADGSALDPDNPEADGKSYGWYLSLRPNEKVMWEAPVIDGYIVFPTFDPTPNVVATHNPPNQCGSESPPEEEGEGDDDGEEPDEVCSTAGIGRIYKLWYQCGMGEYSETDNPISGVATYTEGSTTKAFYPGIDPNQEIPEDEWEHPANHVVTNWRQY